MRQSLRKEPDHLFEVNKKVVNGRISSAVRLEHILRSTH